MGKKSRQNTSSLSQPVVEDTSSLAALSSFSPQANLFAFVSLAVDKHRLRVYDTVTGKSTAEHTIDSARVSTLIWEKIDFSDSKSAEGSPKKKGKRKRLSTGQPTEDEPSSETEVIILGLTDGTLHFFSPTHGRLLRTLSHPSSTSSILSIVLSDGPTIRTSGADGFIRLWDVRKNSILDTWKIDDRMPYTSMAIRPSPSGQIDMLVANHTIRLLSTPSELEPQSQSPNPKTIATFTGHASSILSLQWDPSQSPPTRFFSTAESDRFIYVWKLPPSSSGSSSGSEGKLILSIPLDATVRQISLSPTKKQTILALSASGKITVYPIPTELTPPSSSEKTKHKVPTLLPRSTVNLSLDKSAASSAGPQILDVTFVPDKTGCIKVARALRGVRPVFHDVQYLEDSGDFIKDVKVSVDDSDANSTDKINTGAPNKRYTESDSLMVHSGLELGQEQQTDDLALHDIDGDLDVDLAELSLGQRLTALEGGGGASNNSSSDDEDDDDGSKRKQKKERTQKDSGIPSLVPANSLTLTLIQALHSSDTRLLETCLAHSDSTLIRNTVRRLPPQLAVPLLTACVERLSRGKRAAGMKGGGGGASSQRGSGLMSWIKVVLAVHSGHLMTMPDLVARLATLHATLTTRLALQDSLLSLSGRLDMVLSQIEMRSSAAPAPLSLQKSKSHSKREARKYVEGESEDEDDDEMDVEVDSDEGSVEDVELGGESEDESDSDSEDGDEDDSEDEEDSNEEANLNGFIDDEAEEYSEDEDEDESE